MLKSVSGALKARLARNELVWRTEAYLIGFQLSDVSHDSFRLQNLIDSLNSEQREAAKSVLYEMNPDAHDSVRWPISDK